MANILKVEGVAGNTDYNQGALSELATGEYIAKLQGESGREIFDEMRRSDPQVKSVLNAITLPIRRARYYVEPPTDKQEDKDKAEIIAKNFFEEMSITWDDTIRHALLMEPLGFSILEKVWEAIDGMYKIRKLDPRLPKSVVRWDYDKAKKRLKGPVQQDTDGAEYFLPIEKILVFTNEREGDNWEGVSILRPAYKPWFIKQRLEKLNAIKHDRHAVGIPRAKLPPGVDRYTPEWGQTEDMLENIYANEMAYIMQPDGYEVDILGVGGDKAGTDSIPSIMYCDRMIARGPLVMFVDLGTTETGSRALGGSFIDFFLMALDAKAEYICEVISRFVIPEYCKYNWEGMKEYPRLKVGGIKTLDTDILATLAKAGVVKPDSSLEIAVRSELNLPEPDKQEEQTANKMIPDEADIDPDHTGEDPPEQDPGTGEGTKGEEKALAEKLKGGKLPVWLKQYIDSAVEKKLNIPREGRKQSNFADRELTDEERIPNLYAIDMRLNEDTRVLREDVLEIRKAQAEDLIIQITAGRKINKVRVIQKGDMHAILMKEYKRQIRIGRAEVREELNRQQSGSQLAEEPEDYEDFVEFADEQFTISVEGAANKLVSTLFLLDMALRRQGVGPQARQTELGRTWESEISTQTWNKMSDSAVNGGWGAGRTIEGNKQSDKIEYAYYSAILDKSTCLRCAPKDGVKHQVGDPEYATPNPDCAGREYCRCITIYVAKEEPPNI